MHYIMTFIWAFILVHMINFVLMSLGGGQDLHLMTASVMAVIVGVVAMLVAALIPDEPIPSSTDHH